MNSKANHKRALGLRTKLSLIFAALIIFLISSMSTILYQYFRKTVEESVRKSIGTAIGANAEEVRAFLNQIDDMVSLLCDNTVIYQKEEAYPRLYKMLITYQGLKDGSDLWDLLAEYRIFNEMFINYFNLLGTSGHAYANVLYLSDAYPAGRRMAPPSDHGTLISQKGIFRSQEMENIPWYTQAVELEGDAYWFSQGEMPNRLCMAKQLRCQTLDTLGAIQSHPVGVIALSFDVSWIAGRLNGDYQQQAYSIVTNRENFILYSNDMEISQMDLAEVLPDFPREFGSMETIVYHGVDSLVQKNELSQDLIMVTIIPAVDVRSSTARTLSMLLIVAGAVMAAGVLSTMLLTHMVVRPLRRLCRHMESGKAELISYEKIRQDEVGMLYRGFNTLMLKIQDLLEDVFRTTEEKKRAELRTLQAQINPHFVYNTLDTVCCLSLLSGNDDVADILTALASIMRYNTKKPNLLVPLSQEIEMIRQYETIQKACYEESLEFCYELEEEAMAVSVPKQILQPLVENAILHGMDVSGGKGVITIRTQCKEKNLIIEIQDNGRSTDIHRLNQIVGTVQPMEEADSLGVRNVCERIRRVYGDRGSLWYRKQENGFTVAQIRIATIKK